MHSRFGAPPRAATWVTTRARVTVFERRVVVRRSTAPRVLEWLRSLQHGFGRVGAAYEGAGACIHPLSSGAQYVSSLGPGGLAELLSGDHCAQANWYHPVPMVEVFGGMRGVIYFYC